MEPLANEGDFEARLGRDLLDLERGRALALLTDASAKVRRISGQIISEQTSTVRLSPQYTPAGYGVLLPQWPVTAVSTAVDDNAADVDVTWVPGSNFIATWVPITVTYTHGYNPVPDEIIAVVCQIAGRAFGTKPEDAGTTNESLGAYSYGTGAAAAAGPLGMLNDERETVLGFRRPSQPISMVACDRRLWPLDSWA